MLSYECSQPSLQFTILHMIKVAERLTCSHVNKEKNNANLSIAGPNSLSQQTDRFYFVTFLNLEKVTEYIPSKPGLPQFLHSQRMAQCNFCPPGRTILF